MAGLSDWTEWLVRKDFVCVAGQIGLYLDGPSEWTLCGQPEWSVGGWSVTFSTIWSTNMCHSIITTNISVWYL